MKHLLVTQDFGPDLGGMARRHVELARRFATATESMEVSTVRLDDYAAFDAAESYPIHRQPFHFREAKWVISQVRWARWLIAFCRGRVDVIHCGNIRPAGYAVWWAAVRLGLPYIVYVNGGDLLRERKKAGESALKKATARRILGKASGIAATSEWVAELTRDVMVEVGVRQAPPIAAIGLGTDPDTFNPERDTGALRKRWGVGNAPLLLTVARIVPHKGQDIAIRSLALLASDFPDLRYVIVGEGEDEPRLRALALELGVESRVIFAGPLSEADLPEAYATSTVYAGPSRLDNTINVEGFGISFLEASSSGLPVLAGDSGGVRSAIRDGETGLVLPPQDADAWAAAIRDLLSDEKRRGEIGEAGRRAVLSHYNWDRVAQDTRDFTRSVIAGGKKRK